LEGRSVDVHIATVLRAGSIKFPGNLHYISFMFEIAEITDPSDR
jgi:hypothetical protein